MRTPRPTLSFGIVLLAGVAIGWGLASSRAPKLLANGADRWGDRALAAGPIAIEMTADKIPVAQDAIYYLNYSTGKLFTTIPSYQQTAGGTQVFTEFAERDLIADFAIKPGMNPHFLMTTGSLGTRGAGWAPLFVVETESGQVITYKVTAQATPGSNRPSFQLLDRRVDPRLGRAIASTAR
jgi:hypothetical protein